MSISDKLNQAAAQWAPTRVRACVVIKLIESDQLSAQDQQKLREVIDVPAGTPGRLSNVDIVKVLRSEGIPASFTAMDRHRAKSCTCYSLVSAGQGEK